MHKGFTKHINFDIHFNIHMYRKQLQSKIHSYCYNTYNYVAIAIMITEATQTHVRN